MSTDQKKPENKNSGEVIDKIKFAINTFADRLRDDRKFAFTIGGVVLAVVVIIILIAVFSGKKQDTPSGENGENAVSDNSAASEQDAVVSADDSQVTETENVTTDTVNVMVTNYLDALTNGDAETIKNIKNKTSDEELLKIQKKSEYIESFQNVNTYSKPGPVANSFVVFVYYEIKFTGIDTAAPGLTTLYLCPNDEAKIIIYDELVEEQLDASIISYIKELAITDEIVDLFDKVDTKYNEAVDRDPALKAFIEGLAAQLENEVAQAMAQSQEAAEPTQETEQPESAVTQTNDTVVAKETVNVRSSDSENADKLGKLDGGTKVKRYETRENGWSKIDYNGQEAFVKSEFLQVDDGTSVEAEAPAEEETTEESATPSTKGDKVRVKETVRIRKSASESGEVLATAYPGETFELLMVQADGWTKIKYNGANAYIKSEFLE